MYTPSLYYNDADKQAAIKYLEDQIHKSIMCNGTEKFCKNRKNRVKELKQTI
jgi:hypothetical protein